MNWDDPQDRARLIEQIGIAAYNEAMEMHRAESTVETVNGYPIRPVRSSRFGRLFLVDGANMAFPTLDAAREHAAGLAPGGAKQ